jgi:hypothetical protein
LLVLGQQLMAPLDRRAQCLLARVDAAAGLEQIQPVREPLDELFGREDSHSRRSQLERERQVLEPRAELRHDVTRDEARQRRTRPRHEEPRPVLLFERRDRIGLLAGKPKQLTARHEQMHVGAGGEQLGESRGRFDDVLEVVEQKQQRFVGQVLHKTVLRSERLPRRHQDELGVTQRRQRHPEDPVDVALRSLGGRLQPKPRLARPARPRQGEQAGVLQQPAHLG